MKKINISFSSEKDKERFVLQCEREFEEKLMSVSDKVIESQAKIVLLTGPTCSGKTPMADKLIHDFREIGKDVNIVSIDDFCSIILFNVECCSNCQEFSIRNDFSVHSVNHWHNNVNVIVCNRV